jgi:DNA-binding NtrC family response regulator
MVRSVSSNVQQVLNAYHWPGNVRELHNVIERAIPFCDGDSITMEALPEALKMGENANAGASSPVPKTLIQNHAELPFKDAKEHLIEAFERQYLIDLLDRHQGNVSKAARTAQMDRKSITRLMKKHQITR